HASMSAKQNALSASSRPTMWPGRWAPISPPATAHATTNSRWASVVRGMPAATASAVAAADSASVSAHHAQAIRYLRFETHRIRPGVLVVRDSVLGGPGAPPGGTGVLPGGTG